MGAKTIAVTGCAGYVGTRLVERLCADPAVERVVGLDVVQPSISHPKLVFDSVDVRSDALGARLTGVDVVVHLAFIMDPIKDDTRMRDVNVNGSQNVFRAAGQAGVRKIVYTSSGTVYGAHPDNEVPLTESSPLRANLDFSYAAHKLEVEYVLREFAEEFPAVALAVFRPCLVFGPRIDNAWSRLLEMPVLVGVRGHRPPFQFVHEDDVADALAFAACGDLEGTYNLGPSDWTTADEVIEMLGRRVVDLPEPAAFALAERMWGAGLSDAPAGILHYVMYPWVVSSDRLRDAGFTVSRSSREAFEEALPQIRAHVRIGRSRVRKGDLLKGAAAGAGLLGAALSLRAVRRRRSLARV
ncbi:MAG TPA: NAD-dependent epimerase/dehydratase family protein [Actinomycetota bacterium]|nr:NAD-dependent epimerase/dehydratase family protein [Actinomycetota bacterium]